MSLLDTKTYKRPDAEVLPLITHATAKAKDGVRRISHQRCCARRAGHRPLSRAADRRVCHTQHGDTPLHYAAKYSSSVAVVQALLAAYPEAAKATDKVRHPRPFVQRSCGLSPTAARLVAQPPPCSPCVPHTGRVHAPPPRRYAQLIGVGGAGAARGVPGCRQGDGQGTPPPALCAARMRPLPHPPPALSLNRPPARRVCHVQLGRTPLHVAAQFNSSEAVVQALLAAYPDAVKATNNDGNTPLHVAARYSSSVAVVQALLAAYPEAARAKDKIGNMPLHAAAWYSSSVSVVQALLAAYPEAAKAMNYNGSTPLHVAARNSSSEAVVQALLAAYPEAAMATNNDGLTPLHAAARNSSSVSVVQALLVAYREAVKATDKDGETPADYAAKYNENAAVKAFFASGEAFFASLLDNDTYKRPDAEVLPLITPAMARANNALGKTPLHRAAKYSSSEAVVQVLLAAYPEAVKATDKLGRMPLHVAARYSSSVSVVQALLEAYPDAVKATDKDGIFVGNKPAEKAKLNENAAVKAFFASGEADKAAAAALAKLAQPKPAVTPAPLTVLPVPPPAPPPPPVPPPNAVGRGPVLIEQHVRANPEMYVGRTAVVDFFRQYLSDAAAERAADKALSTAKDHLSMWKDMILEYCPPSRTAPDRHGKKVLAIGPGLGFLANPQQIASVERAGFDVRRLSCASPADKGFVMATAIRDVLDAITSFKPGVILCASKGGAYMVELWKRMEAGEVPKDIGCLMINAHPEATKLPEGVKVVLVQGSEEDVWPKPRFSTDKKRDESGVVVMPDYSKGEKPDSLEALIRTGSPMLCLLYYTVTQEGHRERKGDSHNPASLLKYNCLPRLIDSLLSPYPPFAFVESHACFTSEARCNHEKFLGFEPRSLRRFWASEGQKGCDEQKRFRVLQNSDEYKAVVGIFQGEPNVERFYSPDYKIGERVKVAYIERIENGNMQESMDTLYGNVKDSFERLKVSFQGGVHTRWLFHGTGSAEVVTKIVEDPTGVGFSPLATERHLWGKGTYFARDAAYCKDIKVCDKCLDEEGHMMIIMCLVVVGVPCLGQETVATTELIHPQMRPVKLRYTSMVDDLSNPEIYVVQAGQDIYPAYVIHFS